MIDSPRQRLEVRVLLLSAEAVEAVEAVEAAAVALAAVARLPFTVSPSQAEPAGRSLSGKLGARPKAQSAPGLGGSFWGVSPLW